MDTLCVFIRFCAEMQAVPIDLPPRSKSPSPKDSGQYNKEIDGDRSTEIFEYLNRYQYSSITHALFQNWYCLLRVGAAHGIDLGDIDFEERYIELYHRPEIDMPPKNGTDSERIITISDTTQQILTEYIEMNHEDVVDDHGHQPLFTSVHGRPSLSTFRRYI